MRNPESHSEYRVLRQFEPVEFWLYTLFTGTMPLPIDAYDKPAADLLRDSCTFPVTDLRFARENPTKIAGQMERFTTAPHWKQNLLRLAADWSPAADHFLVPICGLGEAFIRALACCRIGVRSLQIRRGIYSLRKVLELDKRALEMPRREIV